MLLFVTLFLPYYFDSMILLYQKYELSFGQAALEFAQETINQLKQTEQLSKEEREEIEKNLSSLKKQQEDLDNKEKEDKPKQRFRFRRFPAPKNWEANIRMQELTPKPTSISRLSICVATVTAPTPPT